MKAVAIPVVGTAARGSRALSSLVLFELRVALRGRRLGAVVVLFSILAGIVTVLGLAAFRQIGVGATSPAAVALLNLMLLVPSAYAVVEGALSLQPEREGGFLAMLSAARVPGDAIAFAKLAGTVLASWSLVAGGFGASALVLAGNVAAADLPAYGALVLVALLTTAAAAAIGVLISALATARQQAVAAALGAWFLLAIGLDLAVFALASVTSIGAGALFILLALDPLEAGRVLGLLALGADSTVLGPLGTLLRTELGVGASAGLLVAADALWVGFATMAAGLLLSRRRD